MASHDLPLAGAGLTFYGLIGGPPLLLISTRLVAVPLGAAQTAAHLETAADLIPPAARGPILFLAQRGPSLPWSWLLLALVPVGLYGEGLIRAFGRLSPEVITRRPLRGRVAAAGAVVVVPVALGLALEAVSVWHDRGLLLGVYLAFLVAWALATAALVVAYRFLTPASPAASALGWSAAGTGSVLAGFGLGFVLFLNLHLRVGNAYGGQTGLALAAIAAVWAYGLHIAALVGYALALVLDDRRG